MVTNLTSQTNNLPCTRIRLDSPCMTSNQASRHIEPRPNNNVLTNTKSAYKYNKHPARRFWRNAPNQASSHVRGRSRNVAWPCWISVTLTSPTSKCHKMWHSGDTILDYQVWCQVWYYNIKMQYSWELAYKSYIYIYILTLSSVKTQYISKCEVSGSILIGVITSYHKLS